MTRHATSSALAVIAAVALALVASSAHATSKPGGRQYRMVSRTKGMLASKQTKGSPVPPRRTGRDLRPEADRQHFEMDGTGKTFVRSMRLVGAKTGAYFREKAQKFRLKRLASKTARKANRNGKQTWRAKTGAYFREKAQEFRLKRLASKTAREANQGRESNSELTRSKTQPLHSKAQSLTSATLSRANELLDGIQKLATLSAGGPVTAQ